MPSVSRGASTGRGLRGLAIPRRSVVEAISALAERGVGSAIVFSAAFAEAGEEGLAEQREIGRIAAESGMVIEGPNGQGMTNFIDSIPLTFVETDARAPGMQNGTGQAAQESAATHTGAIAGAYKMMRVKVLRAGVVLAETLEELASTRPRRGWSIRIYTTTFWPLFSTTIASAAWLQGLSRLIR